MVDKNEAPVWWLNFLASQISLLLGEGVLFFALLVYRSALVTFTQFVPAAVLGITLTALLYMAGGLVAGSRLYGVGQWLALASAVSHWALWSVIATVTGSPLGASHWALAFTSLPSPPAAALLTFVATLTAAAFGGWLSSRKRQGSTANGS